MSWILTTLMSTSIQKTNGSLSYPAFSKNECEAMKLNGKLQLGLGTTRRLPESVLMCSVWRYVLEDAFALMFRAPIGSGHMFRNFPRVLCTFTRTPENTALSQTHLT